jgi:AcrR family transcriptional regulator
MEAILDSTPRAQTRDLVLDTVDRLLGEIGYGKLTVLDIATRAGISRRTFYLYFASKQAATLGVLDRNIRRLVEHLKRLARAPGDPAERLTQMLRFRIQFMHRTVRHRRQDNDELFGQLRALYMPRRERYLAAERAVVASVLDEGVRLGVLALEDPSETAMLLLLATNALMPFALSPRQMSRRKEIESRIERLVELVVRGLMAPNFATKESP